MIGRREAWSPLAGVSIHVPTLVRTCLPPDGDRDGDRDRDTDRDRDADVSEDDGEGCAENFVLQTCAGKPFWDETQPTLQSGTGSDERGVMFTFGKNEC